jgi:hypothetical protein
VTDVTLRLAVGVLNAIAGPGKDSAGSDEKKRKQNK